MADEEARPKTIGELGEDFVAWLCEQPFARDFVFVRPTYARGTLLRELCDVLILFEDTGVIVQVKTPDPKAHAGWTDEQEADWANKKVGEAVSQIEGALKAIVKGLITEVRNERQGPVSLQAEQLRHFYGLAIVHHPPLDRYGRPPVLEFDGRTCPVLIATISELRSIFEELTTIGDFVDYMRARERFFAKNAMMGISELDILATYKHDPEKFVENVERFDMLLIEEGVWDQFSANEQRAARDHANAPSKIVDQIIDLLHTERTAELTHFRDLRRQLGDAVAVGGQYLEIANELARIRRVDRRNIGRKLIEKSSKCLEQNRDRYFAGHSRTAPDSAILFLISTTSRAERCRSLLSLMIAAKLKLGVRTITGIVTEPVGLPEHSIDAIRIELDPAAESGEALRELRKDAEKLFQQSTDFDEYEFPQ